jgi:hypothetical protein
MLSNEELLIVLRRQINFDRDQKAVAIDCFVTSGVRWQLLIYACVPRTSCETTVHRMKMRWHKVGNAFGGTSYPLRLNSSV